MLGLLHKDRFKRMGLEEVMQHPWVCKRSKHLLDARRKSDDMSKFANFSASMFVDKKVPETETGAEGESA